MPIVTVGTGRALLRKSSRAAGLAAAWTLDDTASGYIDFIGGLALTPGGAAPTVGTGVIGSAARFAVNAANSLDAPAAESCYIRSGFAVEIWVNTPWTGRTFIGRSVLQGGDRNEWRLAYNLFQVYSSDGAGGVTGGGNTPLDVWSHNVGTFDGAYVRRYINGVLVATGPFAGSLPIPSTQPTRMSSNSLNTWMYGSLDEPRIWQFGASGDPGAAFWRARYDLGATAAIRDALATHATHAWLGEDATLTAWPAAVGGVSASIGGNGTVIGTLAGRAAPVFNGSGWYRTAAFSQTITQPAEIITVQQRTGNLTIHRTITDGITSGSQFNVRHVASTGTAMLSAGTNLISASDVGSNVQVWRLTVNGANSNIRVNGTSIKTGDAGTQNLTGLSIGASYSSGSGWDGPIALVAIVSGTNYADRAAIIESAARSYYGV